MIISDTDAQTLILAGKTLRADLREALIDATLNRTITGASTLDLTFHDPDRTIIKSKLFNERTAATVDGAVFELVQVRKTGSSVSVTLEDAVVADLRKGRKLLSAKGGTTTIDAFARRIVSTAKGAKLVAFTGQKNLAPLAAGGTDENYWEALQRLADERAWRCSADRGTVYLGPDSWLATRVPTLSVKEHDGGVEDIDWDCDAGKKSTRASFNADIARWSATPGSPINLLDQGLGAGIWLVEEVSRPLFRKTGTVTLIRQQPVLPEPKPDPRDDGLPTSGGAAEVRGSSVAGPISARGFSWPATGRLSSGYGERGGKLHAGIDIAVPTGTPVFAAKAGTVVFAGVAGGYGNAVYLDHGDTMTRYGHLSKISVRQGQAVQARSIIGQSGNTGTSTGPHLHFEIRPGNKAVNPLPYLPTPLRG